MKKGMFALLLFAAVATQPALAVELWGLDTDDDTLFTLDSDTGAVNTIGTLPGFGFGGLDFYNGDLYALLDDQLYQVDPSDASATPIGAASGQVFESFEIIDGVGYTADVFDETLYSISLADGSATLIGSHDETEGDDRVTGLAEAGGALYGTRFSQLDIVELDTATGGVIDNVGTHGLSASTSLAYGDGLFWTSPAFTQELYSLSPTDGSATLVQSGLTDLGHVTGLSTIPEPTSLLVLGLAGLLIRRR